MSSGQVVTLVVCCRRGGGGLVKDEDDTRYSATVRPPRRGARDMNGFGSLPAGRPGVGRRGGVKVAESISPAIIGSAGARKTPLINTSSQALDNLRPCRPVILCCRLCCVSDTYYYYFCVQSMYTGRSNETTIRFRKERKKKQQIYNCFFLNNEL